MKSVKFLAAALAYAYFLPLASHAHEGPKPLLNYNFKQPFIKEGTLVAQAGPDLALVGGSYKPTKNGFIFHQLKDTPSAPAEEKFMPKDTFTISAWVSVIKPQDCGGIIGQLEDNGSAETGWMLGYGKQHFNIQLSTEKTDDGNGKLVILKSKSKYELGKLYHLAATYDGKELKLYINGKLESRNAEVGGKIKYEPNTKLSVAGYKDRNENFPHVGQIVSLQLYTDVATDEWIAKEFDHHEELTKTVSKEASEAISLEYLVKPYLQFTTKDGITVMWETNLPSAGTLHYGETSACTQSISTGKNAAIKELRITKLKPGTQYFYKTSSKLGYGKTVESEIRTFQTDAGEQTPFAFAVISDTQSNPKVASVFANLAWTHRPNFLLLPGDLVGTGSKKNQWVDQFFPSMNPLAILPCVRKP